VFLSGINEIAALLHEVKTYSEHTGRWIALPLHSALAIEEQDKVFDIAPDGVRKCVISTNIAETSITIDGIRFVIDSGKVKEMAYDSQTKMNRLQEFWISQASSEQRKGRAGRTGPGTCFRLYSQGDFESFSEYATPEIQRVPLESLVLQTIALNLGNVRKFPYIEPPATSNIETSVSFLIDQNALTSSEKLTPIGKMLAQLPVDVIIGKMLIMASLFHVIDPVLIVAAGLSVQSPFTQNALSQADASQVVRQQLESEHGDPFTLLKAFDEWINVKTEGVRVSSHWCRTRGIEQQRLYEMVKLRQQFRDVLMDHRLIEKGSNDDKSRWSMLSEDQQQELRSLRKRHRTENKQKKILKTDEGSAYGGDNIDGGSEEVTVADDLKHLEFKLLHDLSQLQDGSSERHSYTLQDINLLKIVICSGLYPQVAIPDEANTFKKGSELIFHTKSKGFLVLHPTSVFSTNPECLDEDSGSKGCYLLAYE
jgi:HrpA-like RNA helicase